MGTNRFENKSALIIGGASGIGKKAALDMIKEGGKVVIADISETGLAAVKDEIRDSGVVIKADATNEADVEAAVALAVETYGKLDVAVNSIFKSGFCEIIDMDVEQWRSEVDVCLNGVFIALKHEGRQMVDQGYGSIVNVASLRSKIPAAFGSSYCTSKAGMDMLTRCASLEMSPHQVRINCVSPGLTRTPSTEGIFLIDGMKQAYLDHIPMGRTGTVEDISAAILFLASDDSGWITGENLSVDGGWHLTCYPDITKIDYS